VTNARTINDSKVCTATSTRRPRILYVAGIGDVLGTYRHWKDRQDDPSQLSMTYSGQFFDLCQRLGCDGYVLVHDSATGKARDEHFVIQQRPLPRFRSGPAILYHAEQTLAAVRIIFAALRWRVDVVVVASGASHWFPLAILPLFGVKVVPALHCVLWPKFRRPGRAARLINALDGFFFSRAASGMLTASHDIDEQLAETAGAGKLQLFPFLPTYRTDSFPAAAAPSAAPPFRVLYAGRVEREKGVFDLLAAAKSLPAGIQYDICGNGSALDELKRQAGEAGLTGRFRFHGHLQRPAMAEMFRQCHAVVVPTRTDFVEGFNQVVAEAILSGRPVVTSAVCPAVRYLGDAVVCVPPDDAAAYAQAILRLAEDHAFYERCRAQCDQVRAQFFDEHRGWGAALESALKLAGCV
jgi:glycogen synthase